MNITEDGAIDMLKQFGMDGIYRIAKDILKNPEPNSTRYIGKVAQRMFALFKNEKLKDDPYRSKVKKLYGEMFELHRERKQPKSKTEEVEPIIAKKSVIEEVEPIVAKKTPAYETEAIIMGGEDRNVAGRRRPPPKKSKSKEPPTPSKLSAVSDIYEVRKKAERLLGNKYDGEVPLDISTRKGKKYMLQVPNGRKKIHFGDLSSADFTKHKDEKRLRDFKKRNVKWKDYDTFTPAWLSYHLLW